MQHTVLYLVDYFDTFVECFKNEVVERVKKGRFFEKISAYTEGSSF
jgi:hypothetical protein